MTRKEKESREKDRQLDNIFFQIFENMREKNPDFPMDYVLSQLPDFSSCTFRIKNYFTGVVACLTAIWTERVIFERKDKRLKGEEWEEITLNEFLRLVEKIANDFRMNPRLTHIILSYIDASNVHSQTFRLYIEFEDYDRIIRDVKQITP
ncbi:MAG: hypothetical protein ACTSP4_06445 [Candidatus Hodarchaeales archaeon]